MARLIEFADILLLPGPDENDPLSQGLRAVHDCILAELNSFAVELKNGLDPVTLVDKLKRLSAVGRNIFADTYIWHGVEEFADIAERLQANLPMEQATVEVDALIEKNVRYQFGWVFKLRTLSDESKWLNYSSEFCKRIKAELDGPIAHHFDQFRKKLATAVPAAFLGMAEQILMRAVKEASLELSKRLARPDEQKIFPIVHWPRLVSYLDAATWCEVPAHVTCAQNVFARMLHNLSGGSAEDYESVLESLDWTLRKNYGPKLFRGLEPALLSILENAIEAFRTRPLWSLGSRLSCLGKAFSQNGYQELGTTVATMLTRMVLTVPGFRLGDGGRARQDQHDRLDHGRTGLPQP